jgi:hypothetical protein
VTYPNNEVFNPHPANVGTNEVPGTFPSRRASFMGDNSRNSAGQLLDRNPTNGQAEGLLLMGSQNTSVTSTSLDPEMPCSSMAPRISTTACSKAPAIRFWAAGRNSSIM